MTSATPMPSTGIRLDVQMFMQRVAEACLPTNVCVTWTHGPQRGCLVCHVAYTQCRHCCRCCRCRYGCCVAKIINDAPRTCIKNKAQKNAAHKSRAQSRANKPNAGKRNEPGRRRAGPLNVVVVVIVVVASVLCLPAQCCSRQN